MSIPFIFLEVFDIISIKALYIIFCNLMNIKTNNNEFLKICIKTITIFFTEVIYLLISEPIDAKKIIKSLSSI